MNEEQLKEEDYANYSRLLNIQFIDFARKEVLSNTDAFRRYFDCFVEKYGDPPGGPEIMKGILSGEIVLPSKICIKVCKEHCHCPLIGVFNSLINGGLNPELIEASNKVVARALVS